MEKVVIRWNDLHLTTLTPPNCEGTSYMCMVAPVVTAPTLKRRSVNFGIIEMAHLVGFAMISDHAVDQ